MSREQSLQKTIGLLRKPLEYAAGLDPQRLQVVSDLGADLESIIRENSREDSALSEFRSKLSGLDRLGKGERMTRVIELLRILDRIEGGKAGKPSASKAAQEKIRRLEKDIKELETRVQYVKGVGPRVAQKLARLGIKTVDDLLYHLPARYEDRRDLKKINRVKKGERATVLAEIMAAGPSRGRGGVRRFDVILSDGTGNMNARWFHCPGDYLEKKFRKGMKVIASGTVKVYRGRLEMHHPDLEAVSDGDPSHFSGIVPVYPLTEGMFQKNMRRIIRNAVDAYGGRVPEVLPETILEKRGLPPASESIRAVHCPSDDADIFELEAFRSAHHRRLIYEEFFFLQLGLALRRKGVIEEDAVPVPGGGELVERFVASLPFELTSAQRRVLDEIHADMGKRSPMLRLLQGDVGSGKTVVAMAAALSAISAGGQAAIMAPTEILAEQHHRTVRDLLKGTGVSSSLLTGGVRGRDRESLLEGVANGNVPLLVGTHAVIQDKVEFKLLSLAVIDEQHRFGVMQRARLKAKGPKGASPHLLVMTATPIPRTLAMTVYGDLAVSVIDEMPPGRSPVETKVFRDKDRAEVYRMAREEVRSGRQVFVVYPLVEESEALELRDAKTMARRFKDEIFPDLAVALVHGRMKSAEKDKVMREFQAGGVQVLVATSVVEVGIDVPNASMMIVEHADRFGLSQLHQLRGRVGRGPHKSFCFLVCGYVKSEDAWKRLLVMEKTGDGFKIAMEDLAIRGPGEFFGTRQWGMPGFKVANIIRDARVLSEAREDAFGVAAGDPEISDPDRAALMHILKKRWGKRLKLGSVG